VAIETIHQASSSWRGSCTNCASSLEETSRLLCTRSGKSREMIRTSSSQGAFTESGLPEIPDSERHQPSPHLPPLPGQELSRRKIVPSQNSQVWNHGNDYGDPSSLPWQRVHQRLLSWAIIWPMNEIDGALNSTTRGQQVGLR
jgi:hypothetical protein